MLKVQLFVTMLCVTCVCINVSGQDLHCGSFEGIWEGVEDLDTTLIDFLPAGQFRYKDIGEDDWEGPVTIENRQEIVLQYECNTSVIPHRLELKIVLKATGDLVETTRCIFEFIRPDQMRLCSNNGVEVEFPKDFNEDEADSCLILTRRY